MNEQASSLSPSQKWLILVVMSLLYAMITWGQTSLSASLENIGHSLLSTSTQRHWLINAFQLSAVATILLSGLLTRRYSFIPIFYTGIIFYSLGSLACGFSNTIGTLIFLRVISGFAAGILFSTTLSGAYRVFSQKERGFAIGVLSTIAAAFFFLATYFGGLLTEYYSWRLVFFVPGAVTATCLLPFIFFRFFRITTHSSNRPIDLYGYLCFVVALSSLVLLLMEIPNWGLISWPTLASILVFVCFLFLFILRERSSSFPLIDKHFWHDTCFIYGSLAYVFLQAILISYIFFGIYMVRYRGLTPDRAALLILPCGIFMVLLNPLGGKLTAVWSKKKLLGYASLLSFFNLIYISLVSSTSNYALLLIGFLIFGIGPSFSLIAAIQLIVSKADEQNLPVLASIVAVLRMVGCSFVLAVMSTTIIVTTKKQGSYLLGYQLALFLASAFIFVSFILSFFIHEKKMNAKAHIE